MLFQGVMLHFINGALAGMFFPVILWVLRLNSSLMFLGVLYGILLWFLTLAIVHNRITGVSLINHPHGFLPSILSLMLHVVYGFLLGLFLS